MVRVSAHIIVSAVVFVVALAWPSPLGAAEGGGHGGSDGPGNRIRASFTLEADTDRVPEGLQAGEAGPQAVDIPTLSVPVSVDGQLEGYVFVNVRLMVADGRDPWAIREKAHLVRDRLIRVAHATSFSSSEAPGHVDRERARELIRDGLADLIPIGDVERIEFISIDAHAG